MGRDSIFRLDGPGSIEMTNCFCSGLDAIGAIDGGGTATINGLTFQGEGDGGPLLTVGNGHASISNALIDGSPAGSNAQIAAMLSDARENIARSDIPYSLKEELNGLVQEAAEAVNRGQLRNAGERLRTAAAEYSQILGVVVQVGIVLAGIIG